MIQKKRTLNEHLEQIDQNSRVTPEQITKLAKRFRKIFRELGYVNSSKDPETLEKYVRMLFKCQDYRCTHWVQTEEGELNGVWNRPMGGHIGWRTDLVWYEIDHVHPKNAGGTDSLSNYQFLSANANQFTKCSLTYDDLLRRVDLSDRLKSRIKEVLTNRRRLFESAEWKIFMKGLS